MATPWRDLLKRPGRTNLVVSSGSSVVGFVAFGAEDAARPTEIFGIYVHPDHWRRGVGGQLLSAAADRMISSGFVMLILWAAERNSRARLFYEKQGWTLSGKTRTKEHRGEQVEEVEYVQTKQEG